MTNANLSLTDAEWWALREVWREGLTAGIMVYVGEDEHPGSPREAAEHDQWTIVAASEAGEILGEESGQYYLIAEGGFGRGPVGVNVTRMARAFGRLRAP